MRYHDIVSGRDRSWLAGLARQGLRAAEWPYACLVRRRNRRYDTRQAAIHHVGVPVVSVGNLTLGGTGKTPLVAWLTQWFLERGVAVGLISRGYGSRSGRPNDEALELARRFPHVPHVQNPDRVAAAVETIERHCARLLIVDDGFQHRRLARDLDIVLLDALEPFGHGHLFPRGLLREPVCGLRRAQIVALSRADQVDEARRQTLPSEVAAIAPHATWIEIQHRPSRLVNVAGETATVATLHGRRAFGFCAIGNPAAFRRTLEACGAVVAGWREFPDHHHYSADDIHAIAAQAVHSDAEMLATTCKDLVKLEDAPRLALPCWAVAIDLNITAGLPNLLAYLHPLATSASASPT